MIFRLRNRSRFHREIRADRRSGLSLMEVLFAIGVLTVGLLGIASVLPVASDTAARTLQRDKATEEVVEPRV